MNRMIRSFAVTAIAAAAAGCAQSPDRIEPAYVSPVPYQGWSCGQLKGESDRIVEALGGASAQQEKTQKSDAVGVFLIGLPLGSMNDGDLEPEIARLKGELDAVRKASETKGCAHKVPRVKFVAAPEKTTQTR